MAWNDYVDEKKQMKGKTEEELEELRFRRIFKSTHKPFDPDTMLVFHNNDPMCIAHDDNGDILIQL
eukprot:866271-Karenia_brevis.AAC.1